jgi:hypothetical protein
VVRALGRECFLEVPRGGGSGPVRLVVFARGGWVLGIVQEGKGLTASHRMPGFSLGPLFKVIPVLSMLHATLNLLALLVVQQA